MAFNFGPNGLEIQTFDEINAELVTGFQAVYGNDINVDPNTPDGQRIGINAKLELDIQTNILLIYTAMDPDFATGLLLDSILKLTGIVRRPGTRSSWDLTVTANAPGTLPAGYTIVDDLNQNWRIDDPEPIVIGANVMTFFSEKFGEIVGNASSTFAQVTIQIEVDSITDSGPATLGVEEETDPEVRIRRNNSFENPAFSTIGSILAKLANTSGVTEAQVYENDTNVHDAILDLDGNTIWCIVEGGSLSDIADTILKDKTSGCGLKGSITETVTETIPKPGGGTMDVDRIVRFDRPITVDIYVNVDAARKDPTVAIDTDLIASNIAAQTYSIGEDSIASELYQLGYNAGTEFILTDLQISDDDVIYVDSSIAPEADEKFQILQANVTVNDIG